MRRRSAFCKLEGEHVENAPKDWVRANGVSDAIIPAPITAQGGFANIPAKRNRRKAFAFSSFLYHYRNLVERFFGKLRNARGLATR